MGIEPTFFIISNMSTIMILLVLCLIQSLIGVGVLLFGTPIFLLLGKEFYEVLVLLLPVSAFISGITFISNPYSLFVKSEYTSLCIASILGTILSTQYLENLIVLFIAFLLMASVALTTLKINLLTNFIQTYRHISIGVLGFMHGMSNQGGILLVWLVRMNEVSKEITRSTIASAYALVALMQIGTLIALDSKRFVSLFSIENITIPIIGFYLGNIIFQNIKQKVFDRLITLMIVIFINLLILKYVFG